MLPLFFYQLVYWRHGLILWQGYLKSFCTLVPILKSSNIDVQSICLCCTHCLWATSGVRLL